MKKVITIGASNSKKSINRKLVDYTGNLLENVKIESIDLSEINIPLYGIDLENESGIPESIHEIHQTIKNADGIIISLAEHNGNYTVAFKNLFDWLSRIEKGVWQNKPMVLLSTSPGGRGGKSVMEFALASFPRFSAQIIGSLSVPLFNENFSTELKEPFLSELNAILSDFIDKIDSKS